MHISTDRLKRGLFGLMLGGALIFAGCASTGPMKVQDIKPDKDAQDTAGKSAQETKASIEYINVVGSGDRIMIRTTGPVKYTIFKLSEPSRLVVDMPDVDVTKVPPTIKVDNDFINDIATSTYGSNNEIGRVVVTLKDGIGHDIKSGEKSILISLKKDANAQVADAIKASADGQQTADASAPPKSVDLPADGSPAAQADKAVSASADGSPATQVDKTASAPAAETSAEKAPASTEAPVKQATKIVKISSAMVGKNTVILIQTDGSVGNYNAFGLDSPSRIVLDVWGVDNAIGKSKLKIKDKYVRTVRIGNYPNKTRLVFDIAKKIPPHAISKAGDKIILTMGPGVTEGKASALPASAKATPRVASLEDVALPKVAESADEKPAKDTTKAAPVKDTSVTIEGIDFRKANATGRLTVRGSAKLDYAVKDMEDGKVVILDIKNATIPSELERTLDASKLDTSVLAVSSFQESAGPVKDVRILVKLKDKAAYAVNASDDVIDVDFKANEPPAAPKKAAKSPQGIVGGKLFTGKRIDLDMTDANITDVLRLLAEVSNLNIVASDDVKGTITLRLKNVPWDQAFDVILQSKGLDEIKNGNVIMVGPASKIKEEKDAVLASKKAQEKLEDLEIMFIPVNYANASELLSQVKGVLSERGSVTTDARTNTLIVKDIRKGREAAYSLVKKLDTAIPQVLIEARIVEASTNYLRDLGIQWGVDYATSGNTTTNTFGSTIQPGQAPPGATSAPNAGSNGGWGTLSPATGTPAFTATHGAQDFAVNLPATTTLGALGFVLGKAGVNPAVLDLRISAGEQEGHLKTISRPRIVTMDNKEAKIEQGESIPFETTSASGTATTFIDANLSLTVTPHITPDGSILMKIKANHNAIGSFKTASGEPSIAKKEAQTEVLVRDGETTVLGGIIVTDKTESYTGIPFLKDIPVIGWIFKNSDVTNNQQELLIFITPTIVHEKTA